MQLLTVSACYEDCAFYVSTGAQKMLEIAQNNGVTVTGMDWFAANGTVTDNEYWQHTVDFISKTAE